MDTCEKSGREKGKGIIEEGTSTQVQCENGFKELSSMVCIWITIISMIMIEYSYWNDDKVDVRHIVSTNQMIHCGVYDRNGKFLNWMTAIYAHNQLEKRKIMWKDREFFLLSATGSLGCYCGLQ